MPVMVNIGVPGSIAEGATGDRWWGVLSGWDMPGVHQLSTQTRRHMNNCRVAGARSRAGIV